MALTVQREFPDAGHVALGFDTAGAGGMDLAGFAAAGLEIQRDTVLTAQALREPPHPSRDASIRQLAGDGDWQQSAALQGLCDAEDGLPASPAFTAARNSARRRLAESAQGAWFGAFMDGELVSQLGVISGPDRVARYQDVGTHPAARRRGLAGTLVCHAGQYAFDHLGASTLVIVADPQEGAIRVYRAAGFGDRESQISAQRAPSGPDHPRRLCRDAGSGAESQNRWPSRSTSPSGQGCCPVSFTISAFVSCAGASPSVVCSWIFTQEQGFAAGAHPFLR